MLAPAVALLVRRRARAGASLLTAAGLSVVAAVVAVLQYFGVDILGAWPSGWRQPSFVGVSELGALGAAALAIGFVGPCAATRSRGARAVPRSRAGRSASCSRAGSRPAGRRARARRVVLMLQRDGVRLGRARCSGALPSSAASACSACATAT